MAGTADLTVTAAVLSSRTAVTGPHLAGGHDHLWHPMHIHGHTFQLGGSGPRKDTAIVLPGQTLAGDFDADYPGRWMTHCHNTYHAEAGMMTVLGYHS